MTLAELVAMGRGAADAFELEVRSSWRQTASLFALIYNAHSTSGSLSIDDVDPFAQTPDADADPEERRAKVRSMLGSIGADPDMPVVTGPPPTVLEPAAIVQPEENGGAG
ncbi:MAG: hypothetical protein AAF078_01900 [Planctomycetota bacterium]